VFPPVAPPPGTVTPPGTITPPVAPPPGPVVPPPRRRRGWLERNLLGLLALVPLFAAAGWIHRDDVTERYWAGRPREVVVSDAAGWVSYAGARIRLASLEPATDLVTFGGDPYRVPDGLTAWRAAILFQAPDQDAIASCTLRLEDTAGNTYGPSPDELTGAKMPFASCTSGDEPAPPSYEVVVYFVTPASAQASAVRVTVPRELPRYARLTPAP